MEGETLLILAVVVDDVEAQFLAGCDEGLGHGGARGDVTHTHVTALSVVPGVHGSHLENVTWLKFASVAR